MVKEFDPDLKQELDAVAHKLANYEEKLKEKMERLQREMKEGLAASDGHKFANAYNEWIREDRIKENTHINIAGESRDKPLVVKGIDFHDINFEQFDLSNIKFEDCKFTKTCFNKCKLENVELSGTFEQTQIIQGTLNNVKLNGSLIQGIKIESNIITGEGLTVEGTSKWSKESNYIGQNKSATNLTVNVTLEKPYVEKDNDDNTMRWGEFRIKDNKSVTAPKITFNYTAADKPGVTQSVTISAEEKNEDKVCNSTLGNYKASLGPKAWTEQEINDHNDYISNGASGGYQKSPNKQRGHCGQNFDKVVYDKANRRD